jgi:predicted CopG family antitoxin
LNVFNRRQMIRDAAVVERLSAMRGSGESYSDVILRLVELEAGRRS